MAFRRVAVAARTARAAGPDRRLGPVPARTHADAALSGQRPFPLVLRVAPAVYARVYAGQRPSGPALHPQSARPGLPAGEGDRKSTRLKSSHLCASSKPTFA